MGEYLGATSAPSQIGDSKQRSGLDALLDRTSQAPHEIGSLVTRLCKIADHLEGPQPTSGEGASVVDMEQPSLIQRVDQINDALARGVRDLAEQIERLERNIGG